MSLNNSQYNTILREYDQKQYNQKKLMQARTDEIYKAIPEFKELDDLVIANSMKCAKLLLLDENNTNAENQLQKLDLANMEISMKKVELLKENGYPANYLTPTYECNDCKDTGFVDNKPCHCFKHSMIKLLYSQDLVNKALEIENFDNFRYDFYSSNYIDPDLEISPYENILKVLDKCHKFINDFNKPYEQHKYKNFFIYGNTGVGKTFLTNCIARDILNLAHSVVYLTASDFFEISAKANFNKNDNFENDDKIKYITTCDLLIIDDLGTELANTFTNSQLYSCINNRILKNLSTVISSNIPLNEIRARYSERFFSRIVGEYEMLRIIGNDLRIHKKKSQL